ncbi:MAG TPA: hypothetical protein VFE86_01795 [Ilumatobacteraceae bacterium]|jgi:hypothetical protein|nr:hypothetical protein [Ilumatobacteraceae bacterium]
MNTLHTNTPSTPAPTSVPSVPSVLSKIVRPLPRTAKLLCAGIGIAAVGSFLPWVTATDDFGDSYSATASDNKSTLFALLLIGLAASAWAAWPALTGRLSKLRRVGLTAAAAFVSVLAVESFVEIARVRSAMSHLGGPASVNGIDLAKIDPGIGLLMYTAGSIVLWVGVACAWRSTPARVGGSVATTSFPPPDPSAVSFGA